MITTEHLSALEGVTPPAPVTDIPNTATPAATSPAEQAVGQRVDRFKAAAAAFEAAVPATATGADLANEVASLAENKTPLDAPVQPRNPDGTFAAKPVDEAAPVDGEVPVDPDTGAPVGEEPAPVPVVDTITVLDRNGKELPIEITDPEAAEALRMLKNNGMRRDEFNREKASIDKERRDYREFKAMIATPESFVDQIPVENQMRMLNYMLANHWESVKPTLEDWYANDISRERYQLNAERQKVTQASQVSAALANGDRIDSINAKIDALVPEHATHQDVLDFVKLASVEIGQAEQARGTPVQPDEVPALLDRHLRRFGFQSTPATPTTGSLVPTTPAVASPQGGKAEAIAKAAQANTKRMAALPAAQQAARAVAPSGAGTAPAVAPKARTFEEAAAQIAQVYAQSGRA